MVLGAWPPGVFTSGFFAQVRWSRCVNRDGIRQLTEACRTLQPFFHTWKDCAPEGNYWRDEFCFNLIAALYGMLRELPDRYNVQLHSPLVKPCIWRGRAYHNDEPAAILHFADRRGKTLLTEYLRDLGQTSP